MKSYISVDEQRLIFRMRNNGISFRRIAKIMDCSLNTVQNHYRMEKKGIYCKTAEQTRGIDWTKVNTGIMSVKDTTERINRKYAESGGYSAKS